MNARTDDSGLYRLVGLSPGEFYVYDPDVLASLRDRASRFILTEAESKTLDLALIK